MLHQSAHIDFKHPQGFFHTGDSLSQTSYQHGVQAFTGWMYAPEQNTQTLSQSQRQTEILDHLKRIRFI